MKTKWNRKWKTPHTVLERRTLCLSSYKNRKLKVNSWWVGARERKKGAFFAPLILSEGNFVSICVLSQCIINIFENTHTLTYEKTLLHTLLLLAFKTVESLQYIFNSSLVSRYTYWSILKSFLNDKNIPCIHTNFMKKSILLTWIFKFREIVHVNK